MGYLKLTAISRSFFFLPFHWLQTFLILNGDKGSLKSPRCLVMSEKHCLSQAVYQHVIELKKIIKRDETQQL